MLLARPGILFTRRSQGPSPAASQKSRGTSAAAVSRQAPSSINVGSLAPLRESRSLTRGPSSDNHSIALQAAGSSSGASAPLSSSTPSEPDSAMEVATVGGGCFWCIEACYNMLQGVQSAVSGYAAGHVRDPTYQQVCSGSTGHAEVVQIRYDPRLLSYRDILEVFFAVHDPTTQDRQGADVGPQYRSIILTHSEAQRQVAQQLMEELEREGVWGAPLTTQLQPLEVFYPAEDHHQNYFVQNPGQGYCRVVVGPKVAKFRSKFAAKLKQ